MTSETRITDTTNSAQRALKFAGQIIDSLGPRPAGSDASQAAAEAFKEAASQFADRTWSEDFEVHPGSFLGWIRLLVIFYTLSVIFLWIDLTWAAALLSSLGLAIMVGQFFLYREVIDVFFPRRTGRNVLAAVEPDGEARAQLIVSGHHDSAHVFNFLVHQPALYPLRVYGGLGSYALLILASWLLTLWTAVAGQAPSWSVFAAGFFSVLLLIVGQLWWFASARSTPGAGDNLASSAAAWEVLRQVTDWKAEGQGLRHLRVIAASWDAEEAGLRGARHFASQHKDGRLDLPTWNLNLECLYAPADLFLLTSDINGSVPLSSSLAERCQRLLAQQGLEVPAHPIEFLTGGTDAAELAKVGVEATTLMGMPWGNAERSTVYHTPNDTLETVSPDALARAIRLALDLARDLDQTQA